MSEPQPASAWNDATMAACLLAVDPVGLGGASLRALAGPLRDEWLTIFRAALPQNTPVRRVPLAISDARLLGGIDLSATLRAGRPVADRGILAESDGGAMLLAMAERLTPAQAARLTSVLDTGEVQLERDGLTLCNKARLCIVALDEGMAEDEHPPAPLLDRLAFRLDLSGISLAELSPPPFTGETIAEARAGLPCILCDDAMVHALCATALALGIASLRAPLLALAAAKAAAALAGRDVVSEADAALAGRLVLAPRATILPMPDSEAQSQSEPETPPEEADGETRDETDPQAEQTRPLEDVVLEATQAAIPAGLLAQLKIANPGATRAASAGKAGAIQKSGQRGRPAGVRRGLPKAGARLNVVETLRAAAPWQKLRQRATSRPGQIEIRPDDFHVTRYKQNAETATIFAVDASGSSALNRLAEAKGAVELLLADCYIRRDRVAVIAFRGKTSEVLLPPTRSLARAKRTLAGMAGGGGTPLALGIDTAAQLASDVRRKGLTPLIVFLTDGAANVARDGRGGRVLAGEQALSAARQIALARFTTLLVDTSPRPQAQAQALAAAMNARYLALPHAGAAAVSQAVRGVAMQAKI